MSDDDRDIDIESDDGDDSDSRLRQSNNTQYYSQAEKRAHHNALERKRRDHIKDSFSNLRDVVPTLQGEKVASRAQILKKAAEYIRLLRVKQQSIQQEIDDIKKQNITLENEIRELEQEGLNDGWLANVNGEAVIKDLCPEFGGMSGYNDTESESSDSETDEAIRHSKKQKTSSLH
ncbi:PREDICTED: protein max isoform X2 [Vollenhovia emeryi]|uniref:protein max isoform X2 n=1 Tax=Vollenhovia emeryi TaxID=411798 RepID=UPI0005F56D41|nr:PREDICTED: protein max isoform X2 [Vollenhovia emeryi]